MIFENPLHGKPDAAFEKYMAKGAYKRALHRLHMMSLRTLDSMVRSKNPVLVDRANYHLALRINPHARNKMGRPPKGKQQEKAQPFDPMEQYEKLLEESDVDSSGQAPAEGLEPQPNPGSV